MIEARVPVMLTAFLCAAVVGCGGGERTVTVTETVTAEAGASSPTPKEDSEASDARRSVGDEQTYSNSGQIEIDGKPVDVTLKVRVSALRSRIDNPQYLEPGAGNRYARMTIRIRNVGNDAYEPSAEFQAQSRSGESATFQSLGQPGDLGPAAVRPGGQARGHVWAEIPKKAVIDQIIFAPFGGDPDTDLVWEAR